MDGQRIKYRRNIAENYNGLSRVHERYRQTDGRATPNSGREREFTFAKKRSLIRVLPQLSTLPFFGFFVTRHALQPTRQVRSVAS